MRAECVDSVENRVNVSGPVDRVAGDIAQIKRRLDLVEA
jgi:hypothetical protein